MWKAFLHVCKVYVDKIFRVVCKCWLNLFLQQHCCPLVVVMEWKLGHGNTLLRLIRCSYISRQYCTCELDGFWFQEEERVKFHLALNSRARPACFSHELSLRNVQNMRRINDSVLGQVGFNTLCVILTKVKVKGKAYLYSAFRETSTQGAQVWITQGYPCKLHHTCLYLANIRQMAPPEWQTSHSARYLFIDPGRMKGWVGLVGWPIADVIPT